MPIAANVSFPKQNMRDELFRDLLIVNRRTFDEAVAGVQAEANRDIDRALREASVWAYEEANRSPKSELQRINDEAQRRPEREIADIQAATASRVDLLKTQLREREQSIRAYCEQLEKSKRDSQRQVASPDQHLTCVHAPVPPKLSEAFGYSGQSRFVAFYHEPTVDELMYDDGHTSGTGEWYAFERWREHPAVTGHLQDINFGCSDLDATHWLIIDRERDLAFVAHVSTGKGFLQQQHPRPLELQPCEIAGIRRRTHERQRVLDAMLAFLDGIAEADQDSPPPDGA